MLDSGKHDQHHSKKVIITTYLRKQKVLTSRSDSAKRSYPSDQNNKQLTYLIVLVKSIDTIIIILFLMMALKRKRYSVSEVISMIDNNDAGNKFNFKRRIK